MWEVIVMHLKSNFENKCSDYTCKAGLIGIDTDVNVCVTLYLQQQKRSLTVLGIF